MLKELGNTLAARLIFLRESGTTPAWSESMHSSMILLSRTFWCLVLVSQYSNGPPAESQHAIRAGRATVM